jgi:CheY-like chemotaxis protein
MDALLVEDNAGDVRLAREAFRLSKKPINLHVVGDGGEAMAFLRTEGAHVHAPRPHLILLDLNLPKMDGREVLANIKADENLKSIPTIILTSSELESDIQHCYENNANCYLKKPTDWDTFDDVVRSVNKFWFGLAKLPRS